MHVYAETDRGVRQHTHTGCVKFGATDGLLPLPRTVRELEAAGMFEGDTGHTTAGRTDDYYRRSDAAGSDGQSMKEKLDAEERGTLSQAKM